MIGPLAMIDPPAATVTSPPRESPPPETRMVPVRVTVPPAHNVRRPPSPGVPLTMRSPSAVMLPPNAVRWATPPVTIAERSIEPPLRWSWMSPVATMSTVAPLRLPAGPPIAAPVWSVTVRALIVSLSRSFTVRRLPEAI